MQSVGWSEAWTFWSFIEEGIVLDVEQCCRKDGRDIAGKWFHFGGEGGVHDDRLRENPEFVRIADHLHDILMYMISLINAGAMNQKRRVVVTVLCAWGKHRSRLLVKDAKRRVEDWRQTGGPDSQTQRDKFYVNCHTLSDWHRRKEIEEYHKAKERGDRNPVETAKRKGYRKNKKEFPWLKGKMRKSVGSVFYCDCERDDFDAWVRQLQCHFGNASPLGPAGSASGATCSHAMQATPSQLPPWRLLSTPVGRNADMKESDKEEKDIKEDSDDEISKEQEEVQEDEDHAHFAGQLVS